MVVVLRDEFGAVQQGKQDTGRLQSASKEDVIAFPVDILSAINERIPSAEDEVIGVLVLDALAGFLVEKSLKFRYWVDFYEVKIDGVEDVLHSLT